MNDAQNRLGVPVIPISAKKGTNVSEKLVPALVDALPELAVAMGRALPPLRRAMANRVIKQSAVLNSAAGAEPIPFIDIPVLLTTQVRMMLKIATIYGEPFTTRHAKELIGTIAGGLAFRYIAQQGAKLVPVGGWAVAAGIAAAGTWAIGQVCYRVFRERQAPHSPTDARYVQEPEIVDRRPTTRRPLACPNGACRSLVSRSSGCAWLAGLCL